MKPKIKEVLFDAFAAVCLVMGLSIHSWPSLCFLTTGLFCASFALFYNLINYRIHGVTRSQARNWACLFFVISFIGGTFYWRECKQLPNAAWENPVTKVETNTTGWLPPELPPGCKDVVIYFGSQGMVYPLPMLTNYPMEPVLANLPIDGLPTNVRTNLPKMPGFSPRTKEVLGGLFVKNIINGKNEDFYPVLPQVISNRLYVFVKIPFTNQYQRIVMSDQMDSVLTNCLPQSPAFWDWNYSRNPKTNVFEIVNENKNPIVQVIYKTPREVLVNGIFFVSHYDIQATFDGMNPGLFSIPNGITNMTVDLNKTIPIKESKTGQHPLIISQFANGATNFILSVLAEDIYSGFATNQKPIFKYPSNIYPGEFAK